MRQLILLLIFLVAAGCARVQVSQDYDTSIALAGLQTYAWKPQASAEREDVREDNPLLHKRIYLAIDKVLAEMGYQQVSDEPDFYISYDFSIVTRTESAPFTTRFGVGIGSRYRYGGFGFGTAPEISQYDVGIITIDIYDASTGQLAWRGTGSEILANHPDPERTTAMVQRIVQAILAQFPPG